MSNGNEFRSRRKIAVFKDLRYGGNGVVIETTSDDEDANPFGFEGYARITEWLVVEFKPLSSEGMVGAELVALNKLREKTVNEFGKQLAVIDGRIANLRSLPAPDSIASTVIHADEDAGCEGVS
jgi:hypothetical protein